MKFSILALALSCASASPIVQKRQASVAASGALSANDVTVLQLALYLEHLETSLYSGGYSNFTEAQYEADGLPFPNRENINVTASQEATHASTIAAVLTANGVTPVPACTYTFPYTSPKTFFGVADLITSNGIGAYLGAADLIMDNPALLTEAASILTTEARHDAYLRAGLNQSPFPMAFDTPSTAVWTYNLAQPFIVHCPEQLPLPILPALSVAPSEYPASIADPIAANSTLSVTWTSTSTTVSSSTPLYLAFIYEPSEMPVYMPLTLTGAMAGTATLPAGVVGTYFAVLTTFSGGLNATTLASTGTLAGPAVFAVNSAP